MPSLTGRPIINAIGATGGESCECGCGVVHASRNSKGHSRGCRCKSCIGKRNRKQGVQRQREAYKAAGGTVKFRGQAGNEENWNSFDWAPELKWEMKTGGSSLPVWVTNAIAQVQAAHDMGLYRPGLMIQPAGSKEVWCLVKMTDLKNQCTALSEVGQGYKVKGLIRQAQKILDEIGRAV